MSCFSDGAGGEEKSADGWNRKRFSVEICCLTYLFTGDGFRLPVCLLMK